MTYEIEMYTTDPNNNDTDSDGLLDGEEMNEYFTNPLSLDTDNDTLLDYNEIFAYDFGLKYSDPTKSDSDNDTMPDAYELAHNFDPMKKIDGDFDADMDGFDSDYSGWPLSEDEYFTNAEEYLAGTDPLIADSDGDGIQDGWEFYWGLDPLVSDSENDIDNDTLSNLYEYDNRLIENSIFSLVNTNNKKDLLEKFDEESSAKSKLKGWNLKLIAVVAISWSLFQLWYASPLPFLLDFGKIIDVPARAVHLAFGMTLCFLIYNSQLVP